MNKEEFVKQGKRNKASGARFELRVRKDFENKGYLVDKWTNNFDLEIKKFVPAKRKFNPFLKVMSIGTGFPDFICIKSFEGKKELIGLEVKSNGYLDKTEKEKCSEILKYGIFDKIIVAKKGKRKGEIVYKDFELDK